MAYVLSKLGVSNEDLSNIIINGSKKEKDDYIKELKGCIVKREYDKKIIRS